MNNAQLGPCEHGSSGTRTDVAVGVGVGGGAKSIIKPPELFCVTVPPGCCSQCRSASWASSII